MQRASAKKHHAPEAFASGARSLKSSDAPVKTDLEMSFLPCKEEIFLLRR